MEICEEFNDIKKILEYFHNDVKPFNKLHFRGGNEIIVEKLAQRLQEYLVRRSILRQDVDTYTLVASAEKSRKILMFLVLNTDVVYKYNLQDDNNINHILEVCPLMPPFLLIALIWDLHLDKYFYELLSYSPCWFSFQYFPSASDSLKYIEDPFEVLEKVHELLKAIFISITFSIDMHASFVDMKIIHNKLFDYAMNLLRLFYTPDADKLGTFTKKQYYKYIGFVVMHLLQLILYAFDVYEQPNLAEPPEKLEIFNICSNTSKKSEHSVEKLKFVNEHKLKIIYAMLNALQNNVMIINVDIFIYWVEVDMNDSDNLQRFIGNMAYKVNERITSSSSFDHGVAAQLTNIAIRPKTMPEILKDATIGEILLSLEHRNMPYHIKKAWFDELLSRHIALGNEECLETIKQNIKLMNVDNCQKLLDFIKIELQRNRASDIECTGIKEEENFDMDIDTDDFDDLMQIILNTIENFSVCQIIELLTYQHKLFGFNTSLFAQVNIMQRITEFLNNYNTASNEFNIQKFLCITFEHPQLVWQKFFDCALYNKSYIGHYCSAVKLTMPLSNKYYLAHVEDALQDADQIQQRYMPNLLCELYFQLYYPHKKAEFLKQIIHKYVKCYLDSKQFECLLPLIRCLHLIGKFGEIQSSKPPNFGEITSPVLLMAAQIMDKARWDLITYTDIRNELLQECIEFIQETTNKFLPHATEKDRKWIRKIVKDSYKPLTQYYFQEFSLTNKQLPLDFDRFITRNDTDDQSDEETLLMSYIRCTMKETEWLTQSERFLPHISDAMFTLSGIINETENSNSINNYRHCLINYANVLNKILLPKIENDDEKVIECLMKVLKIISATPISIYEETFLTFESLIIKIIKIHTRPISKSVSKTIENSLKQMNDCRGKQIVMEKFSVLIEELK